MDKRDKEVNDFLLDEEKKVLKEIQNQYKRALNDINRKIRILQSDELTQSKIYQLQYQQVLKTQVESILETLHGDEYTTIQRFLSESYTNAFVGTVYAMHGQGVPVILPIDNNAAVKAVMTDSKIKDGLYKALGVDVNKLKKSISSEITRGIASGMSLHEIARNISQSAKAPLGRAKTIVRTESHRIQQASTFDAQKGAKAKGANVVKQWDSTLDGDTRPTHRHLDGQIREVEKPFEADGKEAMYPGDFGDPAEDCNCRCVSLTRARWALDEDELKTLQERAEFFGLTKEKAKTFEDFKTNYIETSQMATESDTSNDWSKAVPRNISKAEKKELIQYAESKGVTIPDLKHFDGDPELLKAEIDTLSNMQKRFPVGRKVVLSVGQIHDDGEFANTTDCHITINYKALRDRAITEKNILLGGQFASTMAEGIIAHEYGHVISNTKGNKSIDFVQKAHYNVYGDTISGDSLVKFLTSHVSKYAVTVKKNKLKEIIPEVLAKNSTNPSEFSMEFVKLLEGWLAE